MRRRIIVNAQKKIDNNTEAEEHDCHEQEEECEEEPAVVIDVRTGGDAIVDGKAERDE